MKAVVFAYSNVGDSLPSGAASARAASAAGSDAHRRPTGSGLVSARCGNRAERDLPVTLADDPTDAAMEDSVAAIEPDLIFSFYYRAMIPVWLLALARVGAFNMHGSLLPLYRGRATINWAILVSSFDRSLLKPCQIRTAPGQRSRRLLRIALVALSVQLLDSAHAQSDDTFGGDKRAHFLGGMVVGGLVSEHNGLRGSGVLAGCGVGVLGELIEAARYGWFSARVSAKDFAAECVGSLLGAYIGVQMAPDERVAAARAKTAAYNDSWTSTDKVSHLAGGMALSAVVAHHTDSATAGLLSGCGVAAGGELIDAARYGWHSKHPSAKDFATGCLGAVAGAFASVQVAPGHIVWSKKF